MLEDREYMTQDRFDVWLNAKLYQPDFQIDEAFLRDLFQFETDEFLIDYLYHVFVGKYMGGYPKEHLIDLLCEIQSVPHLIDHERTLYQTDRLVDMIINANCQKILLVIALENGKVKTFKNSELKELEEANARHLARLRGNK